MNLYVDSSCLLDLATMGCNWQHADLLRVPSAKMFTSNLALAEVTAALNVHDIDQHSAEQLKNRIYRIWTTVHRIPVDDLCLGRASELMSQHFLSLPDAIHIASAERAPSPKRFLTLNQSQDLVAQTIVGRGESI